jgi:type II secretion system protein C
MTNAIVLHAWWQRFDRVTSMKSMRIVLTCSPGIRRGNGHRIVRIHLQNITRGLSRSISPKSVARLRSAIPYVLVAAIAAQVVQVGIDLQHARALLLEATKVQQPPARPSITSVDIRGVLAAHLFGTAAENDTEPPAESEPAPIQWVLSGVVERAAPKVGFAIIGETAGSTRLRLVGEEIAKGFKLVRVLSDRVMIEHRGRELTIRLPKFEQAPASVARLGRSSDVSTVSDNAGGQQVAMNGATVETWHPPPGQPANRPPAMLLLKPQVHLDANGHYNGMRIVGPENGSTLASFGLARDDVITKINGRALSTPELTRQGLAQMSTGTTVMVTVERGGISQDLQVTLPGGGG